MRVVLDGVFNHTGRGFWPFHHVLETGAGVAVPDWFHLDDATARRRPAARSPIRRPTDPPADRSGYEAWWGLPALPKLNTDEPEVREYLFGVAEHWLRFGIDGWRLDVPGEIDDEAFWQEFRRRCRAVRPEAYLVGEIWQLAPDWLARRPLRRPDELPAGRGDPRLRGGRPPRHGLVAGRTTSTGRASGRSTARRSRRGSSELAAAYDPDVVAVQLNLLGRHDTPRLRTVLGGDAQARAAGDPAPGDAARRPVHLLRRRGRPGRRQRSGIRARFPWDEGRWEPGLRESVRALAAPAVGRAGPARRAARGRSAPTAQAVAFERGGRAHRASSSRVNAGESAARSRSGSRPTPIGTGGAARPIELPRVRRCAEAGDDRRRPRDLELPPRSGPSCGCADRPVASSVILAVRGRPTDRPRATGSTERLARLLDVEAKIPRASRPWVRSRVATSCSSMAPMGSAPDNSPSSARGSRSPTADGPARLDAPDASADVLVGLWTAFRGCRAGRSAGRGRRVLRPGGRLLVVHDYGRDDVSRLRGDLPEYGLLEPARRAVPARRLPGPGRPLLLDVRRRSRTRRTSWRDAFGAVGRGVAAGMKRPRLSYNVAVYHRTFGGRRMTASASPGRAA